MTVACGGGASQVIPGVAGNNIISLALIDAGLIAISPWLAPVAGYVDAFIYNASQNCLTDPPAMPVWGLSDLQNIIGGVLNPGFPAALQKLNNTVNNYLWSQYCQCVPPTGTPAWVPPVQPSGVTSPGNAPPGFCFQQQRFSWKLNSNNGSQAQNDLWYLGFANPNATCIGTLQLPTYLPYAIRMDWTVHSEGANPLPVRVIPFALDTTCANQTFVVPATGVSVVNPGSSGFQINYFKAAPATYSVAYFSPRYDVPLGQLGTNTIDGTVTLYCAPPTNPLTPCCPPDPAIATLLQQVLQMTQSIYQSIITPISSYAESTVHAGLVNSGSLNLGAQTIAVKVTITQDPPNATSDPGNPSYLFNRGYIVPLALEGPIRGNVRLVYSPQLYQLPTLTDAIGYTLPAGEIVTITELTRGP